MNERDAEQVAERLLEESLSTMVRVLDDVRILGELEGNACVARHLQKRERLEVMRRAAEGVIRRVDVGLASLDASKLERREAWDAREVAAGRLRGCIIPPDDER